MIARQNPSLANALLVDPFNLNAFPRSNTNPNERFATARMTTASDALLRSEINRLLMESGELER